jgi:hypothetical protein
MEINIRTGTNASQMGFPINGTAHKILRINGSFDENLSENYIHSVLRSVHIYFNRTQNCLELVAH